MHYWWNRLTYSQYIAELQHLLKFISKKREIHTYSNLIRIRGAIKKTKEIWHCTTLQLSKIGRESLYSSEWITKEISAQILHTIADSSESSQVQSKEPRLKS